VKKTGEIDPDELDPTKGPANADGMMKRIGLAATGPGGHSPVRYLGGGNNAC